LFDDREGPSLGLMALEPTGHERHGGWLVGQDGGWVAEAREAHRCTPAFSAHLFLMSARTLNKGFFFFAAVSTKEDRRFFLPAHGQDADSRL